ncbi:Nif3-like dinuclear metal center hexameric protein [Fictibacillus phosphorivorans]|uniref:Nif3-like dinuclear metal center hexameric protein n=1 Tax=Fictibacillus phosphorivorans TaxID=1221500 RepID=UPI0020412467|nr:Nif3-like dinuclear metal center hexameric protein [Fictibacillus phosphorivorans]MCM3719244.1 Nif3-like dinuclear metal center hexameric protein [Fictibacillus phosphorivorans]MCM3776866.1 Nif3-like dinuclear metal center hexameric protein [Fictibacillus phosphorivorans]
MKTQDFEQLLPSLFGKWLTIFEDEGEYGFTYRTEKANKRIAFSTNLTPETVEKTVQADADLLLTHHDAWDFLYGMREECTAKLKKHNISHFFIHLPLDFVEFGTCTSLFEQIEIDEIKSYSTYDHDTELPGIGIFHQGISYSELKKRLEKKLDEPVRAWQNHDRSIKKVAILTGAGNNTGFIQFAKDNGCDVFITGERTLYSLQYAKYMGVNLMVGCHTYTEIFGVESFCRKVKEFYPDIELVQINEEHIESIQD